jgi:hypothetical protein
MQTALHIVAPRASFFLLPRSKAASAAPLFPCGSVQVVVLAWCQSSYDFTQLTSILLQLCHAQRGRESSVVVVLTQARLPLAVMVEWWWGFWLGGNAEWGGSGFWRNAS